MKSQKQCGIGKLVPKTDSISICDIYIYMYIVKGSLGGETSVLRTFRMSGKELVKETVSEGKS